MQIVTMIRRLVWPVAYWQPICLPPEASSTIGQMSFHLPRTRLERRSSVDAFYREYMIGRQCGKTLAAMAEIRQIYEEQAERYDRTVCSRRSPSGIALPANSRESVLVSQHAKLLRGHLLTQLCHTYQITADQAERLWREAKPR